MMKQKGITQGIYSMYLDVNSIINTKTNSKKIQNSNNEFSKADLQIIENISD